MRTVDEEVMYNGHEDVEEEDKLRVNDKIGGVFS